MKIIDTDNFGGDYPAETVIAANIKRRDYATAMCDALVRVFTDHGSSRYFCVVDDDYVLRPGFEP